MKYIIYLTTNKVNNKIYIGVHGTENPEIFDGYLGNGVNIYHPSTIKNPKEPFQYAVKKYGFKSFIRTTLFIFDSQQEALDMESYIVNDEFIKRDDTYNIALGGGLPPRLDIKTYQYDINGKFLKEWDSRTEAGMFYGNHKDRKSAGVTIALACQFKRTAYNYFWSNEKFETLNLTDYKDATQNIACHLYDLDFNYVKTFNSISDAAKSLNLCFEVIRRAIKFQYKLVGKYYLSLDLYSKLPKQINPKVEGKIHQYSLDETYITTFDSIKEIEKSTGLHLVNFNTAIKMSPYYKGFLWIRGEKLDKVEPHKSQSRKVGQYTLDGKFIKEFSTVREARKEFPNVNKVLAGKAKHCHNYTFKYLS